MSVTVTGHLGSTTATKATFSGSVFDRQGNGVADLTTSVPVAVRTARVSGQVFGDANSNGRANTGEGVSGVKLDLGYRFGPNRYVATTGAGGRFSLVVPLASYYLSGAGSGWTVIPKVVTVGATGTQLPLRAVKPLGDVLRASIHFTKHTYAPGDVAHIVVMISNIGSTTLRGMGAECDHAGDPDELHNSGAGWGPLAFTASGVTILPHTTRTVDVTDTVPAAAQRAGQVVVACDFGYNGVDAGRRPSAQDTAKVPGQSGAFVGTVLYYPNGTSQPGVGLANVRAVLVDASTCRLYVRRATSAANGNFGFGGVPAGAGYKLYLYPPTGWKITSANPSNAFVLGNDTVRFSIQAVRGTAGVPAAPTRCATPTSTPAPATSSSGGVLANTGADPAGPAVIGGVAILLGLLLALLGRREPQARRARHM